MVEAPMVFGQSVAQNLRFARFGAEELFIDARGDHFVRSIEAITQENVAYIARGCDDEVIPSVDRTEPEAGSNPG
jgi:hypothetical protein